MRNLFFFLCGVALTLLLGLLAAATAAAAEPLSCDVQLTVELTPDVPDPSDAGFLSSLLNNHPGYRLELVRALDPALVQLELSGPGPGYLCVGVIDTMRKDARVLSVRIDEGPVLGGNLPPAVSTKESPAVDTTGIGSLYWAARHPRQAWRVVLPIHSGEKPWENALRKGSEAPAS